MEYKNLVRIALINCGSRFVSDLEESLQKSGCSVTTIKIEDLKFIKQELFEGIVLSGSPSLLTEIDTNEFLTKTRKCVESNLPILGICCGHQLLGLHFRSTISKGDLNEGDEQITILDKSTIFKGINKEKVLLKEAHREEISLPGDFKLIGTSDKTSNEAMEHKKRPIFGVQFHPETSGDYGLKIIENFINIVKINSKAI